MLNLFDEKSTTEAIVDEMISNTDSHTETEEQIRSDKPDSIAVENKKEAVADNMVEDMCSRTEETTDVEQHNKQLVEIVDMQQKLKESIDSLSELFSARIMHTEHEEKNC